MVPLLSYSVPAKPGLTRWLTLEDGKTVEAVLVGDEHGHYWLGVDGKAYQSVPQKDVFRTVDVQKVLSKAQQRRSTIDSRRLRRVAQRAPSQKDPLIGNKKALIILVNFNDVSFSAENNRELFDRIANEENFSEGKFKGSMYDYFYAQSGGQFKLKFDVVGPYTLSESQEYYGSNDESGDDMYPGTMVVEALALADSLVNYKDYDWDGDGVVEQVYVVYAGKGAADGGVSNTIWPHEWKLSYAFAQGHSSAGAQTLDDVTIDTYACGCELNGITGETAGIGTMCHEFSHCLGFPDFYDVDYSGGQGMGYWDLMCSGSYNGDGYQPAGYTSYERWEAGWITPRELSATQTVTSMKALQDGGQSYVIYNPGTKNEFFMLENRQKTGWDESLPGAGLLILHVDYDASIWGRNQVNDDPSHQRMTWIPADNEYQYDLTNSGKKNYSFSGMSNDPYPYEENNSFGSISQPAATLYNANADGELFLHTKVTNIVQNTDAAKTVSFTFVGDPIEYLSVTDLALKDGDLDMGLIDGTTLRGTLYLKNLNSMTKKADVTIGLEDVEAQTNRTKQVFVTIAPNTTVGYDFSFGNLTAGHHYVITVSYASGEEFYRSAQLLCTTEGINEVEPGNEALVAYEYWFDDDFDDRRIVSMSSNNAFIRASINTEDLSNGVHRFNFRLRRSDGWYSAINSSVFLNLKGETKDRLDYWLDEDYDHIVSMDLANTEAEQELTLDLQDPTLYPVGFHQLNFRVVKAGFGMSNVYTTEILKLPSGVAGKLEYWFDDDIAHSQTLDGKPADGDNAYIYVADIDVSQLSVGMHRFNYRARNNDGTLHSAVKSEQILKIPSGVTSQLEYWFDDDQANRKVLNGKLSDDNEAYIFINSLDVSQLSIGLHRFNYRARNNDGTLFSSLQSEPILKVPTGDASILEYWFDDDMKNSRKAEGHAVDDGYTFIQDLNLNGISPGAHRLSVRVRSADGKRVTAINTAPIIVHSEYTRDYTNAKILGYSIAVDNEEPKIYEFANPRSELVMSHVLDGRNLSKGNHTLKTKFWNEAYAGISLSEQFNVPAYVEPTLTLTAQEESGLVRLQFDAVPNDLRYRIVRTDANGASAGIGSNEGSIYPSTVTFTDNPTAGSYTYFVQMVYKDRAGERQTIRSNEVTVSVSEPQTEVVAAEEFGYITGRILCDKNMPSNGLKVNFSDGVKADVRTVNFVRMQIPVGTELTLTVTGDDTHEYESKTLTVKAGANDVTLYGTLREEYQPNNLQNDLAINSNVELYVENGAHFVKFKVKNLSHYNDWRGFVRIKAIDTSKAKTEDAVITMSYEEKPLYVGEDYPVTIGYNDTKEMTVLLKNLKLKKDTDFYLYFESVGGWLDVDESITTKPIAPNSKFDVAENPVVKTIGKTELSTPKWDSDAKEDFAYLMMGLSSVTPGMDGLVGDLSPFETKVIAATGKRNAKEACAAILGWLEGKSALEAINDPNLYNITSAVKGVYDNISSAIMPPLTQRYWKNIVGAAGDVATAGLMINEVKQIATAVTSNDTFEQSMACANILYTALASNSGAVPLSSMMYTYMVVGKSLIEAARSFAPIMNSRYIVTRMKANKPYNGGSENRQNSAVDFKLVVQTNTWFGHKAIDFTNCDASKQIQSISIKAAHQQGQEPAEFGFTPVFKKDCVMLRSDGKGITNNKHLDDMNELAKFYMEINWANGRQTQIPLNKTVNGVDISFNGVHVQSDGDYEAENPVVYTVTLTTTTGKDKMADELYLGTNKNRE